MKFFLYEKGGGGISHAEGGGGGAEESFGVVFPCKLKVLAILKGGAKSSHPLKGGTRKCLPCLEGRCKKFRTRFPPPPRN